MSVISSKGIFLPVNCPSICRDFTICSMPSRLGTPLPVELFSLFDEHFAGYFAIDADRPHDQIYAFFL